MIRRFRGSGPLPRPGQRFPPPKQERLGRAPRASGSLRVVRRRTRRAHEEPTESHIDPVAEHDRMRYLREKPPVGALRAADAWLLADSGNPFVAAGGLVAGTPGASAFGFFRIFRGNFLGSSASSVDRSGLSTPCKVARSAGKGGGTCPLPIRCRQRPGEPPSTPCPESSDLHECLGPGGTGEGSRRQAHAAWAQPPVSQAPGRGAPAGAREPWSALRRFMQVASRQAWEHRFPRHLRGGMRSTDQIRWERPRDAGSPTVRRPSGTKDRQRHGLSRSPDGLARLTDEERVASAPLKTSTNPFLRRGMATGRAIFSAAGESRWTTGR